MTSDRLDEIIKNMRKRSDGSFWMEQVKLGNQVKYEQARRLGTSERADYYPT